MGARVTPNPRTPAIDRLSAKLVEEDGCWLFTGYRDARGYGRMGEGLAHRIAYEFHVGPVPDGLELDHLCRVPACCNPEHLDPVPHSVNVRRGASAQVSDTCAQGHDLTNPQNVYAHTKGVGRKCAICTKARARARHLNNKENAA